MVFQCFIQVVFLDKILFFFPFNVVQYLASNLKTWTDSSLFHCVVVWHLKLEVEWLELLVCIVIQVVLHEIKFESFSVRTVLKELQKQQTDVCQKLLVSDGYYICRDKRLIHLLEVFLCASGAQDSNCGYSCLRYSLKTDYILLNVLILCNFFSNNIT